MLGSNLSKSNVNKHITLTVESKEARTFLIKYLNNYPLKSSKSVAFTRFKKLHVRFTDGRFKWRLLQPRAKARIEKLIKNINTDS